MSEQNNYDEFWRKVKKTNGCWLWTGRTNRKGYGVINLNKKPLYVHRLMWEIRNGNIPDGMLVCHRCDNPRCVNPDHLFVGTIRDNNRDRDNKGRSARGAILSKAHLKPDDIIDIRKAYAHGTNQSEIARKYGIKPCSVNHIVHRERWAHIP